MEESSQLVQEKNTSNGLSFDVHCHITDTEASLHVLDSMVTHQVALMGTDPDNWLQVIQCHRNFPKKSILGFGT